jgi:CYTH domain-containing protein
MSVEIEKKFLVIGDDWKKLTAGTIYRQGYLKSGHGCTVRVRIAGERGYLTVKGVSVGAARKEYEYEIPLAEAGEMLENLCNKPLIEKRRYRIPIADHIWEVDEFFGENEGLVIAEVELKKEDEDFVKPEWVGMEVTGDIRYYNANLVNYPFTKWK